MKRLYCMPFVAFTIIMSMASLARPDESNEVKETALDASNKVKIKIRMEGPYTADVPLQIVCYFKYTPAGAKRMAGAPVELDKRMGGVIGSLRERAEFVGDRGETLLIVSPKDSIKAKLLLLVGLGDEEALSLEVMEEVGRIGLREAARIGVDRVAFAPLLRDQGNMKFSTGDVERAVTRGVLLAYDTQRRLQQEGFAQAFALSEWIVEAGPAYYDDTVVGVQRGIKDGGAEISSRSSALYSSREK